MLHLKVPAAPESMPLAAALTVFGAQVATGAFCIAIAHLINHSKDAAGAIAAVQAWLQQGLDQVCTCTGINQLALL